jgi:hypothetical protein
MSRSEHNSHSRLWLNDRGMLILWYKTLIQRAHALMTCYKILQIKSNNRLIGPVAFVNVAIFSTTLGSRSCTRFNHVPHFIVTLASLQLHPQPRRVQLGQPARCHIAGNRNASHEGLIWEESTFESRPITLRVKRSSQIPNRSNAPRKRKNSKPHFLGGCKSLIASGRVNPYIRESPHSSHMSSSYPRY